jgi:predicted dehydrogenase
LTDTLQYVLGDFTAFHSLLANQRPQITFINTEDPADKSTVEKDTADHVFIHGILSSGAAASVHVRAGAPIDPLAAMRWSIFGTEGQIETTGPVQLGDATKVTLKVGDKTETFQVEGQDAEGALAYPAANVARIYKAFAEGGELVDFDTAVERHKFLEELYNGQLGGKAIFSERI